MTDAPTPESAAAAPSAGDAAAASSRAARTLLDAAVARAITVLAHDLRNSLGVVSMQVEAVAVRSASATPDLAAILAHANVASDNIERLAAMTNALIAFASGRRTSDLAVIVGEAAELVPLRAVSVSNPVAAESGLDPLLARAVALEVLVLALGSPTAPTFTVRTSDAGSTLQLDSGYPLQADEDLEWVVQFRKVGGRISSTEDGLRLLFPPNV